MTHYLHVGCMLDAYATMLALQTSWSLEDSHDPDRAFQASLVLNGKQG